jgi:hypothetical protein
MTFEQWAATQGGNIDITNQFQHESWKAGQESMRSLVEKMREALHMNHLQNAMCYGREYTVLWSKTEASLAEADKFLGEK